MECISTLSVGAAVNGITASPPPSAALVAVAAARMLICSVSVYDMPRQTFEYSEMMMVIVAFSSSYKR